jgi:hypothetical protein
MPEDGHGLLLHLHVEVAADEARVLGAELRAHGLALLWVPADGIPDAGQVGRCDDGDRLEEPWP